MKISDRVLTPRQPEQKPTAPPPPPQPKPAEKPAPKGPIGKNIDLVG